MTQASSAADSRVSKQLEDARVSIDTADADLAAAEAATLGAVRKAKKVSPANQRLLKAYAEARDHLGRAAKVLTPCAP